MKKKVDNWCRQKTKITCFISQNVYNLAVVVFPLGGSQFSMGVAFTADG